MDIYSLSFSLSPIGAKTFQRLIKIYGSSRDAWENFDKDKYEAAGIKNIRFSKFEKFRNDFDSTLYIKKLDLAKVDYISYFDKNYPRRLKELNDPPIGLFIRGNKELLLGENNIGVVGSRKITSYGVQVTSNIVADLVGGGLVIISGMAMGVDAVAHNSAIDNSGSTIAVLGCGVDCPYPRENEKLYDKILDSGGAIISEYPLGMSAARGTFPARNRIIAGLSIGVLITEAADGSGSLITANYAKEQGKPVFAVPGPITSQVSRGTHRLIREGAIMIGSGLDILSELSIAKKNGKKEHNLKYDNLGKEEKIIIKTIENEGLSIDDIAKITGFSVSRLSIILSEMEIGGLIVNNSGRYYIC